MPTIKPPFYPIIYVRGYAMTKNEIEATVATPYMGFNLGAVKVRQDWKGNVQRHYFESPLVRLMKDYGYTDIYTDGKEIDGCIPARSIVICRYYDQADTDLGTGKTPTIEDSAKLLGKKILKIKTQICDGNKQAEDDFKVYLVAHSMGGLVCRCLLQNDKLGADMQEARALVDKVFTYATPHNGIEMGGMNVPGFMHLWDMNNFNRKRMAEFLDLPGEPDRVDSLNGKFEPQRFFSLVGTNHKDYEVFFGISSRLAGEMSDGLVKIENAAVQASPRAFVYRSHSGPYGIVNSEEGYQNLVRFLFGNVRVDGIMEVDHLPLPPSVEKEYKDGKEIRSSYFFEATVMPRGAMTYKLTERRKETFSAVFRKFDDLFELQKAGLDKPRSPHLFTAFLDRSKIAIGRTLVFTLELAVSSTGYVVDKKLWWDTHIAGEDLFRKTITIRATLTKDKWNLSYIPTDERWGEQTQGKRIESDAKGLYIPLESGKGFKAKLRLQVTQWA